MRKARSIGCLVILAAASTLSLAASAAERSVKPMGRYQIISVSTSGAFSSECLDGGAVALTEKVNDAMRKGASPLGGVSVAVNPTTNTCLHAQAVLWPEGQE